ncbi:MAG: hypothetical protein K1X56_10645 [Flavobacteriales bacterium]|nr:hypothetical protein [Flavobacteriales bacterium]
MVKKFLILTALFGTLIPGKAQGGSQYIHKGLIAARGALCYGKMFDLKANNIYLDGNVEYYLDNKVSLRGDGYLFMNSFNGNKPLKIHHSLFAGPLYHFKTNISFDPYIGLQPGINLGEAVNATLGTPSYNTQILIAPPEEMEMVATPLISPIIGFNFYGTKWFHIWCNLRYIQGRFLDNYNSASLSEFRVSFGLGFNIR